MSQKFVLRKFALRRISVVLLGFLILNVGLFAQPKTLRAENSLYISQVKITDGAGHTAEDFVELFNPGSEPVNLKDLRLVKRTAQGSQDSLIKSWTEDMWIPTHGFYLWANVAFSFPGVTADAQNTATLADNNGIALRAGPNDTGLILDSAAWGNTNNGFKTVSTENPGANQALFRQNLFDAQSVFIITNSQPRNSQAVDASAGAPVGAAPATSATDPPTGEPGEEPSADPTAEPPLSDGTQSSSNDNDDSQSANAQCTVDSSASGSGGTASAGTISSDTGSAAGSQAAETASNDVGSANSGQAPEVPESWSDQIKISEILANPMGEDSGNEAVEIENNGSEAVNLANWWLDDASADNKPKNSAYGLPPISVLPHQVAVIVIPRQHFALNNTGDTVNLFFPDETLADFVTYDGSGKEGEGYQKVNGEWLWREASLGMINPIPPPPEAAAENPAAVTLSSSGTSSASAASTTPTSLTVSPAAASASAAAASKTSTAQTAKSTKTSAKTAASSSTSKSAKSAQSSGADSDTPLEETSQEVIEASDISTAMTDEVPSPADEPASSSHPRWWIYALMVAAVIAAGFICYRYFILTDSNTVLE